MRRVMQSAVMTALGIGFVLASTSTPARASDCTFTGPVNGSWTTAANWSCGVVPGAADTVTINSSEAVLDTNVTVAAFTLSGTGVRKGTGTLTVTGAFLWTGGHLRGGSNNIAAAGGTLNVTTTTSDLAATLTNNTTASIADGVSFGGATVGTFANAGTLTIQNAGFIGAQLVNTGTITKNGTDVMAVWRLANNGTVTVNQGRLDAGAHNTVDTGNYTVALGATLAFTLVNGFDNGVRSASGNIVATGTLRFGFGGFTQTAGTVTFNSGATQELETLAATQFNHVTVTSGTVVTEQFCISSVNGTFTNQGRVRCVSQFQGSGPYPFGLTGVRMDINASFSGGLTSMQVERVPGNHPSSDGAAGVGEFWTIAATPSNATFTVTLALPHHITPQSDARVCRFTGSARDCAASSATATLVRRTGVTAFSDWAVGNASITPIPPPPPPPPPTFSRFFAEGATGSFFDTSIALLNTTGQAATATLKFLRDDGQVITHAVNLSGLQRATVDPESIAGLDGAAFGTVIESTQPIVADRTMRWDGTGYGSHAETSIDAARTKWYLAEGATTGRFNLFYLIQNPGAQEAQVEITYLLPAPASPIVKTYTVAAHARAASSSTAKPRRSMMRRSPRW